MASGALTEWNGPRRRRIKLIWEFRDRAPLPWQERQADMLLVMRMAAEFHAAGRALNNRNATSSTLAEDFSRIGLIFWPAIKTQDPVSGPIWEADLNNLVKMRNAIAHDDRAQILKLEQNGFRLQRALTKRWHDSLDSLAATIDDVVASYLGRTLGVPQPW
jgi:hypothetical protein